MCIVRMFFKRYVIFVSQLFAENKGFLIPDSWYMKKLCFVHGRIYAALGHPIYIRGLSQCFTSYSLLPIELHAPLMGANHMAVCQTSNASRTNSQNLNVSRLVLQLPLPIDTMVYWHHGIYILYIYKPYIYTLYVYIYMCTLKSLISGAP